MQTLLKLYFILSPKDIKQSSLLLILVLITVFIDILGIASIVPFVSVLSNPSIIDTNFFLKKLFQISNKFGIETNQDFYFFLGILVFIIILISTLLRSLTAYTQAHFIYLQEHKMGKRLVELYLYQPYNWFLSKNSSDIGKTILSETAQIIGGGIYPAIELISKSILSLSIIILLFVFNTKVTFFVISISGLSYFVIYFFLKKYLKKFGEIRIENNKLRFNVINEAFGGIKEAKVGGLEDIFIKKFSVSSYLYAKTFTKLIVIQQLPRFLLETIFFGGIILLILYMIAATNSFNSILPIISLYAFAGYRLLPAIQQIYVSISKLTFISPSIDNVYRDFNKLKKSKDKGDEELITFNKEIILNDVSFDYPNSSKKILKNINLNITKNSIVGFVGKTGGGKTTVADLILGILTPQKGALEIDGKKITTKNVRNWQKLIGYVPQNIFLSDNTIAENIAYGVKKENIDEDKLKKVSITSNLHDFVMGELPNKYQTIIGERGIRISGGQRQRIAIARALYHDCKLLIFDEATSALDNQTEKIVMNAINDLRRSFTIILIAHRLSTLKKCDKIFLFEDGELKEQGTFNEIIKDNESFTNNTLNKI